MVGDSCQGVEDGGDVEADDAAQRESRNGSPSGAPPDGGETDAKEPRELDGVDDVRTALTAAIDAILPSEWDEAFWPLWLWRLVRLHLGSTHG
jgi:hypothetical protein